eukprot:g14703.t1
MRRCYRVAEKFFTMPEASKLAYTEEIAAREGYGGSCYTPLGEEPAYQEGEKQHVESFSCTRPLEQSMCSHLPDGPKFHKNLFPDKQVPGFGPAYTSLWEALRERVALPMMDALEQMLCLPRGFLSLKSAETSSLNMSLLRALRYPARHSQQQSVDSQNTHNPKRRRSTRNRVSSAPIDVGISDHTDFEVFTIMHQDSPGLYLRSPSRGPSPHWFQLPFRYETLTVILGDMTELWSSGWLEATRHKVDSPAFGQEPRRSFVLFQAHDDLVKSPCCCEFAHTIPPLCVTMDTDSAARLSPEEVARHLGVDVQSGLSLLEVSVRQGLVPPNELEQEPEDPLYKKYLEQFKDPLILLLLGSAVLSLLIKQYDDAVSIFMAVTIVATVAFVQEYRSEQSLQALTTLLPPHATCLRGGKAADVLARELVPGDIVLVKSGDRIPADCRVVQTADLFVDESSLTGEGHAREKGCAAMGTVALEGDRAEDAGPVSHGQRAIPLAECTNMVFMGTLACGGHAKAVVIATGMKTEFGKTFEDMKEVESRRTPLQMKMDELGKQLSVLSFGIIGIIAIVGVLQGKKLLEMFNIGVSLAVAAIPEGLPICVTVTLALGVMRMAKRNAIVKRLPAVEALGCATVICADKTGTLTRNEMTVKEVFVMSEDDMIDVAGVGYEPVGDFTVCGRLVAPHSSPAVASLLEAACLCNNAVLGETAAGGGGDMSTASEDSATRGQPTEICLLVAAQKFGVADPRPTHKRVHEVAFSSSKKKMEVRCVDGAGEATCYVKGSVEAVLPNCSYFQGRQGAAAGLGEGERRRVLDAAGALGSKGRRVMAVACGKSEDSLVFCGLVGIMDPPRASAIAFAERMQACSTRMCMITGDAEDTAVAVASAVGFFDPTHHRTLSGAEIERMTPSELKAFVHEVAVFYRTSPRHKLSIVKALQGIGEVVVMTGDGVNDAPALKAADIGVAMGISGSDVAKEAADMVLMDDDIATITAAIEEGKAIFYNIKNFLTFQLSTAVAALSIVAVATFLGFKCPINAMQILWINIIMDGPPAQSLGVEPVHGAIVQRPPRRASDPVISRRLIWRVLSSGALIVVGTLWVFSLGMTQNGVLLKNAELTRRDTTMTFTTFMDMFANKAFIYSVGGSVLGQMLVVYLPWLQSVFQTEALSLNDLAFIVFVTSSMVGLDTARKLLFPDRQGETSAWAGDMPEFYHNSSIAESVNSWLSGYRAVLMRMPRALNTFILDNTAWFRNELLACSTLLKHNPTFDR